LEVDPRRLGVMSALAATAQPFCDRHGAASKPSPAQPVERFAPRDQRAWVANIVYKDSDTNSGWYDSGWDERGGVQQHTPAAVVRLLDQAKSCWPRSS
jgi:hypothetical protein